MTDKRNPNLKPRIAVGDEGDVFVKVMVGKASSELLKEVWLWLLDVGIVEPGKQES